MFVSFVVVRGHELARQLAGGRVRVKDGEDEVVAVGRRIAQDTRCRIVEVRGAVAEGQREAAASRQYELTLRGCLPYPAKGPRVQAEGTIRVTLRSGADALGPLGSRPIRV
ncbi:MAG: hypothetical protein JWM10_4194 [Myxococcaceae bacterium]|nr:hypothetical protein [Myxococcaceae bacterium]